MISGKVKTIELKGGGRLHKVLVRVAGETMDGGPKGAFGGVSGLPIDFFAAQLPDPKPGATRRLIKARTNRAGTVLVAIVRDTK